jgi:hypothetical protein
MRYSLFVHVGDGIVGRCGNVTKEDLGLGGDISIIEATSFRLHIVWLRCRKRMIDEERV